MLAHRDQENLLHGHQLAAASKPFNQGNKQLNPKTPGNKVPKTPFKIPLNDENNPNAFQTGKGGGKSINKGNGTVAKKGVLGDKSNFVTPMGPKSRAPLGQKTTNAKAKAFQTPGLAPPDADLNKSKQKSVSVRKPKPRVSHAEPVKIDVLADNALEERDIEYMPPPVKDLPDIPDDGPHNLNLSMFEGGNLTKDCLQYFYNRPDAEGLSWVERDEMEDRRKAEMSDKLHEAELNRNLDLLEVPCMHNPECHGEQCKDEPERKKKVEEEYQRKVAEIKGIAPRKPKMAPKQSDTVREPTDGAAKKAASILALKKPVMAKPTIAPAPKRFPSSMMSAKKAIPPIKPDAKNHAAAVRASNTTLNYSKGRATSATLRKTILPPKERSVSTKNTIDDRLSPAEYMQKYGAPPRGSETWMRFNNYGCFDDDNDNLEDDWSKQVQDMVLRDAEQEFELTF